MQYCIELTEKVLRKMALDQQKKRIRENWNKHAEDYDDQYQHGIKSEAERAAWKELLRDLVGDTPKKILDVGAGTGFLSCFFAELGHDVTGIDLSPGMLAVARRKAERDGLKINFKEGDAENTGEATEAYDIVVNRHLLWAMPHPQDAVNEWARVLKKGGKLIIIDGDWHYNLPKNNIKIFLGDILTLFAEHKNRFKQDRPHSTEGLPMTVPENAKNAPELVRKSGLKVSITGADAVEAAEKANMPLRHRLLNPYTRIIIIGEK